MLPRWSRSGSSGCSEFPHNLRATLGVSIRFYPVKKKGVTTVRRLGSLRQVMIDETSFNMSAAASPRCISCRRMGDSEILLLVNLSNALMTFRLDDLCEGGPRLSVNIPATAPHLSAKFTCRWGGSQLGVNRETTVPPSTCNLPTTIVVV